MCGRIFYLGEAPRLLSASGIGLINGVAAFTVSTRRSMRCPFNTVIAVSPFTSFPRVTNAKPRGFPVNRS
jgi:hypothetical protein